MSEAALFVAGSDGVRLTLRLQPAARRDGIDGVVELADGRRALKARVTAAPEDGRANAAALKLLAKAWGLPKRSLALVGGTTARTKSLHVAGEPAALVARLEAWRRDLESGAET